MWRTNYQTRCKQYQQPIKIIWLCSLHCVFQSFIDKIKLLNQNSKPSPFQQPFNFHEYHLMVSIATLKIPKYNPVSPWDQKIYIRGPMRGSNFYKPKGDQVCRYICLVGGKVFFFLKEPYLCMFRYQKKKMKSVSI